MDRRRFLVSTSALAAGLSGACGMLGGTGIAGSGRSRGALRDLPSGEPPPFDPEDWGSVRGQFLVADRPIDLSAMLLASHPWPVRSAIDEHRQALDRNPTLYYEQNDDRLTRASAEAAADYMGADFDDIALTDSTTMGLGILYIGLRLRAGDEIVTTEHDYYVTHESLRQASERTGATVRKIRLYDEIGDVSADEIVDRIRDAIGPRTRAVALTWVHSGTGLKIPVAEIAEAVDEVNDDRDEEERVLLCVDGVHGFGIEDATVDDLGVDFLAAGAHKWIFGPRGTGILWGRGDRWAHVRPSIPSFRDGASWTAWFQGTGPEGRPDGPRMTPGGFKPFEHRWSMAPAFEFHQAIGKERVRERTHALARQLKEGLRSIDGVQLITPIEEDLSSGIVCCDVEGIAAWAAVNALRDRDIVATVTPYAVEHLRLSPSIRNTPEEVEAGLRAVRDLI
ncbi:MAG: aminotransferase class V-fold PLP-dependent enzyme [Gemmatimonadota bacterium]